MKARPGTQDSKQRIQDEKIEQVEGKCHYCTRTKLLFPCTHLKEFDSTEKLRLEERVA